MIVFHVICRTHILPAIIIICNLVLARRLYAIIALYVPTTLLFYNVLHPNPLYTGVYEERYTLLLSQMNKKRDCYYTISLYSSNQPFRFRPCADMPPHQLKIKGAWSEITSGGTSRSPTFFMNPQYRVFVGGGSAVRLHIQALFPKTVCAVYVCVACVWYIDNNIHSLSFLLITCCCV